MGGGKPRPVLRRDHPQRYPRRERGQLHHPHLLPAARALRLEAGALPLLPHFRRVQARPARHRRGQYAESHRHRQCPDLLRLLRRKAHHGEWPLRGPLRPRCRYRRVHQVQRLQGRHPLHRRLLPEHQDAQALLPRGHREQHPVPVHQCGCGGQLHQSGRRHPAGYVGRRSGAAEPRPDDPPHGRRCRSRRRGRHGQCRLPEPRPQRQALHERGPARPAAGKPDRAAEEPRELADLRLQLARAAALYARSPRRCLLL